MLRVLCDYQRTGKSYASKAKTAKKAGNQTFWLFCLKDYSLIVSRQDI